MPHQGRPLPNASATHHQYLALVLNWLLADTDFSPVRLRPSCASGAAGLARLALLWAWSDQATLIDRF